MTIPRTATVILLPRRKWSFPLPAEIERGANQKDEKRKTAVCSLVNSVVLFTVIE